MIRRPDPRVAIAIAVGLVAALAPLAASSRDRSEAVRPANSFEEEISAVRGLTIVRLDPKAGARPDECDDVTISDLDVRVGKRAAKVVAVERVPRPDRHWLMIDVSESAEDRRLEAMRSAAQYVTSVMVPGVDRAAVVAVDEDPILIAGPSADRDEIARAIGTLNQGGWSALRDGLDTVLRQIEGDRHEQVVLYWTDGEDQASTTRVDDLMATLARVPNATVFPISLLPRGAKFPPPPQVGAAFTRVALDSGGDVGVSTDARWLDRVRGWLGRRFTVSYLPPTEEDGTPVRGKLEIRVPGKRCSAAVLPDPFARPDPVAGSAPPLPAGWMRVHGRTPEADDAACADRGGGPSWNEPLESDSTEMSGCLLDFTRVNGPLVREKNGELVYAFQSPRLAARSIRIAAPALSALPVDAVSAVESVVSEGGGDAPWEPSPYFIDGGALLVQRARIAASLYAARPDLQEFAEARLERAARDDLRAIEDDFAKAFPHLSHDQIAEVARASRAGARALAAVERPTDSDLARVLTAWVGDVPASDLLLGFERHLIDERLVSGPARGAENRWQAMRALFAIPSRSRILTPLALIHDPVQDVVGFVRIVLPRPEGFRRPELGTPRSPARPVDRIVRRPLALGMIDRLAEDTGVSASLSARRYRVDEIAYRDLPPEFVHEPAPPYESATVALSLTSSDGGAPARASIEAEITASLGGPMTIGRFSSTVTGDPAFEAILKRFRATPRPRSRPKRALCCGRRRGSSHATIATG